MTFTYPLPKDTKEKFESREYLCTNLSLLLDRYVGYKHDWKLQEEQKIELFNKIARNFKFESDLVQYYYQRWQARVKFLPHAQSFNAFPEWRMIVGLGQTSILETSMNIDRITGIPIIPGSALKGLAASYAILSDPEISQLAYNPETKKIDRLRAEENQNFKGIFGTQSETGKVIFLDAVPTSVPKLEPDIMNNHYPEYYSDTSGKKAPTPYQNPVPVYFLTLGNKSQFAFAIAGRDNKAETEKLVKQGEIWLKAGLSELGIGAKTSAGYGYMVLA